MTERFGARMMVQIGSVVISVVLCWWLSAAATVIRVKSPQSLKSYRFIIRKVLFALQYVIKNHEGHTMGRVTVGETGDPLVSYALTRQVPVQRLRAAGYTAATIAEEPQTTMPTGR